MEATADGVDSALRSEEATNAEFGQVMSALFDVWASDNCAVYSGPMTHGRVVQTHALMSEERQHTLKCEALAPDEALAMVPRGMYARASVMTFRVHALPEFSPVDVFGDGGAFLRETVER